MQIQQRLLEMKTCIIILRFIDCVLQQCLCKLLLALAVYIVHSTTAIYCTMYTIIIQLYNAHRTLTLHKNMYFYKIHDLQG